MKNKENQENWKINTKLVRGGTLRSNFGETSEAIFLNSGFCYESAEVAESRFNGEAPGFVYSRYCNPTLAMLEKRLALLEGAEAACVVASGMAAVFASLACQIRPGEHLIASKVLFGSCYYIATEVMPRLGVEVTLVDGKNMKEWESAFKKNTKYVFIESPSNPNLELVDIEAVAKLCKQHGAFFIVDNVFSSPMLQHPLELGADCVVYSATKHIDGQGRCLGGAILGSKQFIEEVVTPFHRHTGPAMSPFNAWVFLKGLETLEIRMQRHCDNADKVAQFLERNKHIQRVIFPGLPSHPQYDLACKQMDRGGNMIAFEVKGGKDAAFAFMNKLKIIDICNNLGDSKSLITHPASTTHSNIDPKEQVKLDITQGMLRLSVGLEDVDDLINDISQAL
ncbi:MAG: O-succinylhomoserine sulfhydrylase [Rickettsiales bacterium]|nr:O-succinylhomoserine sulfhydrylase [Pseudomonadota bacterium]MDA0966481.1 O-succinylhomoserine sulfhydrylase [Pseudomonadota bacterium]MDG4543343.1 O-succinylhomoserine sulfhydrylase [Rickettsiales bacterium]MDG4545609.1 O-succinylhomoserine sulfhydrylase [Rickettsiales bacterium]MDG4548058.1 O-succinylhomoserine sulfhydrylase [Rickettsiales bacterium]